MPAAFTLHTGRDHWHPLLQARAIENLAFVLAAAQFGRHNAKRVTYGHACIVDPWGQCWRKSAIAKASPSPSSTSTIRIGCARELPALEHRRL